MTGQESERGRERGAEEVLRALQAEPADRQEAVTPVPGDEMEDETAEAAAPPADRAVRALRAADGDRQESAIPVAEEEEAPAVGEASGDLEERPGELLRTLRQQRAE